MGSDVVDGNDDVARYNAVLGKVAHLAAVRTQHLVLNGINFVNGACGINEFDEDVAEVVCYGDLKACFDAESAYEGGEDYRVVFDVAEFVGAKCAEVLGGTDGFEGFFESVHITACYEFVEADFVVVSDLAVA